MPAFLEKLPTPALIALSILVFCQVALQVFALVDLARRERVRADRKWVWAIVILAGQLIGPIVYLAYGRRVDEGAGSLDSPDVTGDVSERARKALDVLYRRKDRR